MKKLYEIIILKLNFSKKQNLINKLLFNYTKTKQQNLNLNKKLFKIKNNIEIKIINQFFIGFYFNFFNNSILILFSKYNQNYNNLNFNSRNYFEKLVKDYIILF